MTYKEFCTLVDAGENPYLMAFEDPTLEGFMMRWDQETRAGEFFPVLSSE